MLGHAASSEVCAGQKSSLVMSIPREVAAERTDGFSPSGIEPRTFHPWIVDGARPSTAAAARTPPNFAIMLAA